MLLKDEPELAAEAQALVAGYDDRMQAKIDGVWRKDPLETDHPAIPDDSLRLDVRPLYY